MMEQNGFEELKRLMAVGGIDASDLEKRCEVVEGIDDAEPMARLRQTYRIAGDETVEQLLEARRITTYQDKEYWLTLDDGTLVHLNYNTRMVCPERFIDGTRDVILDGEAYFMVAHDSRHPFVVHTPQGDIRVYGTEFNVSTRDGDCTEVVLAELAELEAAGVSTPGTTAEVISREYYNAKGVRSATARKGVNIVRTRLSDGQTVTRKVIIR